MKISPKQFLKSRRPEQFSDSSLVSASSIDRPKLEYYLDTLSNRSQEVEFEHFARCLCEVEICPNLLPHTGPTGGGDSKVDSETYPVSDTTSLSWFTGIGTKAVSERWGFAFSIKKNWVNKIRDDIKKIHETGRNYKVAYFVSSQFIRDKKRAEVEDELRKAYCIDVRILDRTWILDKVFGNGREDIVKNELHIEILKERKEKRSPLDLQKEENIVELDKNIENAISKDQIVYSTVDDAIESAILSREIEKPRIEIDGRFSRAERLAREHGNEYQQFEVVYQLAWTTFWWHEDFSTYVKIYPRVEECVINTHNIYNLERLTNLWYCLNTLRRQDEKIVDDDFFTTHTQTLKKKLEEIAKEEEKPSGSLYAKTLFLEIELAENVIIEKGIGKTLTDLKKIVLQSKNLIGFPFKVLVQSLTEISEALESNPEYGELFKTILQVVEERDGELATAKLLFDRGEKLLSLDRSYEAIQTLGQAITKLYKKEVRDEEVRALYLIGIAFKQVGLFWAARGALLSAASLATSDLWNYGEINTIQAACYNLLKWIELRLGRLPQALDWHNVDSAIRNILLRKGYNAERLFEQINRFDLSLGILILRADLKTLDALQRLPDTLSELGLEYSAIALIYALGCEKEFPKEFTQVFPPGEDKEFFAQWASQYSPDHLPSSINYSGEDIVRLVSNILGCTIIVNLRNQEPCLEVAESILAAIESFLSTTTLRHAAAREPLIEINVDTIPVEDKLIAYEVNDNEERPIIIIHCNEFNPHQIVQADQDKIHDAIFNIIAEVVSRIVIFKDPEEDLRAIMGDERASERALNFTSSFITLGNVLGHKPKIKIADWIHEKSKKYELKREKQLTFSSTIKDGILEQAPSPDDEPISKAKHTDMQVTSVIREVFWDKAEWQGAGYFINLSGRTPPVMSIIFKNIEAGKKIFAAWQKRYGKRDEDEQIRVTIVRGINRDKPYHYRIGIGSNIKKEEGGPKYITSITRIHNMTPESSKNLDMFKKAYETIGQYLLAPGSVKDGGLPDIVHDLGLLKREVIFKDAWEIGVNDIDSVLIYPEDIPIIPAEVKNPPVEELLKIKNWRRGQK